MSKSDRKGNPKKRHAYPRKHTDERGNSTIRGYDAAIRAWLAGGRQGKRPERDGTCP